MMGLAIAWIATAQAAEPMPESLAKKLLGGSTITIFPKESKPLQTEKEKGCGIKRECFIVQYGDGTKKEECYLIKDCHL
jgi:hypothetical protein